MAPKKLSKNWKNVYRTSISCICLSTFIAQCLVLAKYISIYTNLWYIWIFPDVLTLILMFAACVMAHIQWARTRRRTRPCDPAPAPLHREGELPLAYAAWGLYSVTLSSKVAVIFLYVAPTLDNTSEFGPNTLKTAVAAATVIFLLMVLSHTNAEVSANAQLYINKLIGCVSLDILDTVNFLEVLFISESHIFLTFGMHHAIVLIACVNLVLPTLPLLLLQRTRCGRDPFSTLLTTIHCTCYLLLVNLPMLVMRIIFWHVHEQDVSVFLIKNIVHIGMLAKAIYDNTQHLMDDLDDDDGIVDGDGDGPGEQLELQRMGRGSPPRA